MRIGIDMLAVQSPGSRGRGIGRYASSLVRALLELDGPNEYVLYAHEGLPTDLVPEVPRAAVRTLARDPARGEATLRQVMERLATANTDALDALLLPSPFELFWEYGPPSRPLGGPAVFAVMHDLIPFLNQEHYLSDPAAANWLYGHLQRVRRYDGLLTNSEATRADCLRVLGLPPGRVVTIGTASDGRFFTPDRAASRLPEETRLLLRLGIDRPFVFCLGSGDERKNLRGLIDAFALLPERLRRRHRLVIGCFLAPDEIARIRGHAGRAGITAELVLTGELPDPELRTLYRRCAAFAFPSLYEGFGLPLLEAMHCGAAVVAGNNSAQPEVVGDGGLLANAHDPADIASALRRILEDPSYARSLGEAAERQAGRFSWEATARRALETMTSLVAGGGAAPARPRALHRPGRGAPRPRIALFSPFPPKNSGLADYAARLLEHLGRRYGVDLYHEPGYVPEPALASPEFACFDHRLFGRRAVARPYHAVLYQMGNTHYCRFVYEAILRHPGVTTLHDFCLAGFHIWYAGLPGAEPGALRRELWHAHPDRAAYALAELGRWSEQPGELSEAFSRHGLELNRRIFERSCRVVVHSPWCLDRVRERMPEHLDRVAVVPHGAHVVEADPGRRAAARARFGLPPEAPVLAAFGNLHPTKMNVEAIDAFARLSVERPDALLLFVGQDLGGGEARAAAEAYGLGGRVRFLGLQPDDAFLGLVAAADVGIALRRPPTNGETSGALLHLLRSGIATVVTDVGTFADYPASVVRKVRWDEGGPGRLAGVLRELVADPGLRAALGRAAGEFVRRQHDWGRVADLYAEQIEAAAARRAPRVAGRAAG